MPTLRAVSLLLLLAFSLHGHPGASAQEADGNDDTGDQDTDGNDDTGDQDTDDSNDTDDTSGQGTEDTDDTSGQDTGDTDDTSGQDIGDTDDTSGQGLPPDVEFEIDGTKPKLMIWPGGKKKENATWIALKFGKIQEVTPPQHGKKTKPLKERTLPSFGHRDREYEWSSEDRTVGGAQAHVTRLAAPVEFDGKFTEHCGSGGHRGGPHRRLKKGKHDDKDKDEAKHNKDKDEAKHNKDKDKDKNKDDKADKAKDDKVDKAKDEDKNKEQDKDTGSVTESDGGKSNMFVAVEVFVFTEDATFTIGADEVKVKKGQMKFNIEVRDWPFCEDTNSLIFEVEMRMPTDGLAGSAGKRSFAKKHEKDEKGEKKKKHKKGSRMKQFRARAGASSDAFMDLPGVVTIDGQTENMTVFSHEHKHGGKTKIFFQSPYFTKTMVYDPIVGFAPESQTLPPSESCDLDLCSNEVVCDVDDEDCLQVGSTTSFINGANHISAISVAAALARFAVLLL